MTSNNLKDFEADFNAASDKRSNFVPTSFKRRTVMVLLCSDDRKRKKAVIQGVSFTLNGYLSLSKLHGFPYHLPQAAAFL